jgi:hypothetical protein
MPHEARIVSAVGSRRVKKSFTTRRKSKTIINNIRRCMWQEHTTWPSDPVAADMECTLGEAVLICMRRIRGWRTPANWTFLQWREEIECHALAAARVAQAAYDPGRGVPFGAFVYRRVMARVLTRYRQEWRYSGHCGRELGMEPETCAECAGPSTPEHCDLDEAMASLNAGQRWLLEQIFWREHTESSVAAVLGLSQRAVSKRKQKVLGVLRRCLGDRKK